MKQAYCSTHHSASGIRKPKAALGTLALGLALIGCGTQAYAASTYTMTDLTALFPAQKGSEAFIPTAINAHGLVLGYKTIRGNGSVSPSYISKVYNPAKGKLFSTHLVGGEVFSPTDINARGQLAGYRANGHVAIRNTDGTVIDLGVGPGSPPSGPIAMNNNGQMVLKGPPQTNCLDPKQAFILNAKGGYRELVPLEGTDGAIRPLDINIHGQVVGTSPVNAKMLGCGSNNATFHAFISTRTGLKDLHRRSSLPKGSGMSSLANAINDNGLAAGNFTITRVPVRTSEGYSLAALHHAVVWDTATRAYTDLSSFPNQLIESSLNDINASGEVVGNESGHAVVGNTRDGLTDLNPLIFGFTAGLTFYNATDINDAGQVLAVAKDTAGVIHHILLTPITPAGQWVKSGDWSTSLGLSWNKPRFALHVTNGGITDLTHHPLPGSRQLLLRRLKHLLLASYLLHPCSRGFRLPCRNDTATTCVDIPWEIAGAL